MDDATGRSRADATTMPEAKARAGRGREVHHLPRFRRGLRLHSLALHRRWRLGLRRTRPRSCNRWRTARTSSTKLLPNLGRRIAHRLQFSKRDDAWHVFHAAIGRGNETIGRHIFQAVANAVSDGIDALDLGVCEVEHTEHDFL